MPTFTVSVHPEASPRAKSSADNLVCTVEYSAGKLTPARGSGNTNRKRAKRVSDIRTAVERRAQAWVQSQGEAGMQAISSAPGPVTVFRDPGVSTVRRLDGDEIGKLLGAERVSKRSR